MLAVTLDFNAGVLTLTGDAEDNEVTITANDNSGSLVEIIGDGVTLTPAGGQAGVTSIVINLGDGDDIVTVIGSNGADAMSLDGTTLTFAAVPYTLGASVENLTLDGRDGGDTISATGDTVDGMLDILGGDADDSITITTLTAGQLNVDGQAGSDTITLGGAIISASSQTYAEPVFLSADTTLTAGLTDDISFGGSINGAHALTISADDVNFAGPVGDITSLASLVVSASGTITISGGAVATLGDQTYEGPVRINAATSFAGEDLVFDSPLDSQAGTPHAVTLNTTLSGLVTFGGAVGAASPLESIMRNADRATRILGGQLTTTGFQNYGGEVLIDASADATTITGNGITFSGAVNGAVAATESLTINGGAGGVTFGDAVGVTTLASLTVMGPIRLNGSTVATSGNQTYDGTVDLGATTALTGANIAFAQAINSADATPRDLSVTVTGRARFAVVGDTRPLSQLTVNGVTELDGNITTAGQQSYNGAVDVAIDVTLTAGAGGITFDGAVNSVNATEQALIINSPTAGVVFNEPVGSAFDLESLAVTGVARFNTTAVTTSGDQTYQDVVASADVTFRGDDLSFNTLDSAPTTNQNVTLLTTDTGVITFAGEVGGTQPLGSLARSGDDVTRINGGAVTTVGAQTYGGPVEINSATDTTIITGNGITFSGTLNGTAANAEALTIAAGGTGVTFGSAVGGQGLASLSVGGPATINGGGITTTADQSYLGPVVVGADTTFSGLDLTFAGPLDSAADSNRAVTLNGGDTGVVTLGGAVGATLALGSLTRLGGELASILGGTVTTTGAQSYAGPVEIDSATDTTALAGNGITFSSTLSGATPTQVLTITGGGSGTTFGGAVSDLASLTVSGATNVNGGSVTTTGDQTFENAVILGANTTFTGDDLTFNGTLDSAADTNNTVTFDTSDTGVVTLGGAVGGTRALGSLTRAGDDPTRINGGAVTTTGAQSYAGPVEINAANDTTTITGNGITFSGTLQGATAATESLTIAGGANGTTFIGVVSDLASLTVSGTANVNSGTVTTSGDQTYQNAVVLGANTTFNGDDLTFSGALDSAANTNNNVTFDTGDTGVLILGGVVGGVRALGTLTRAGDDVTRITGGAVTTTGAQSYAGPVEIDAANNTSTLTGNGIAFTGTVNGATGATAEALSVVGGAGGVTFTAAVGNSIPLASLNVSGQANINGGAVTTTGDQTYQNAAVLGANTTFAGANITFSSTLDSAATTNQNIVLNTTGTGNVTFGGAVGGTRALGTLSRNNVGTTRINGGAATTTGAQSYGGAVTLDAAANATTISGVAITFSGTLNAATGQTAEALTVNDSGVTTFAGAVGGTQALASLTTDAPGSVAINGGAISATGNVVFNDDVLLNATGDATTIAGTNVTFNDIINGSTADTEGLTVNASQATLFGAAIGGTARLRSLATNAGGTTTFNVGSVATSANQTYGDDVVLTQNSTFTSQTGDLAFQGKLNGAFSTTATATAGAVQLGVIGDTAAPTSLAATAGKSITMTGNARVAGSIALTTNEATAATSADEDVRIQGTSLVESTTGSITIAAADDFDLAFTAGLKAATTMEIRLDGSSNDTAGSTMFLGGTTQVTSTTANNFIIRGGSGGDFFNFQRPTSGAILLGGAGNDSIFFCATTANDFVNVFATQIKVGTSATPAVTYSNVEEINVNTLAGNDSVVVQLPSHPSERLATIVRVHGGAGNDRLRVLGTQADDRLRAGVFMTVDYNQFQLHAMESLQILGLAGDDLIENNTGHPSIPNITPLPSLLDGGEGNDYLVGNDAADVIFGGLGVDVLLGMGANDMLFSGHDYNFGAPAGAPSNYDVADGGEGVDSIVALGIILLAQNTASDQSRDRVIGVEGMAIPLGAFQVDYVFPSLEQIMAELQGSLDQSASDPF